METPSKPVSRDSTSPERYLNLSPSLAADVSVNSEFDMTLNISAIEAMEDLEDSQQDLQADLADETDINLTQLKADQQKSVHLVTWSQAQESLLDDPANSRKSFGEMLVTLFKEHLTRTKSPATVKYWACAKERHTNGGIHFHCAIKFTKRVRWVTIAKSLCEDRDIFVNFQSFQSRYNHAWEYITKEDRDVVKSGAHPRMMVIPPKNIRPSRSRQIQDTQDSSQLPLNTANSQANSQAPSSSDPCSEQSSSTTTSASHARNEKKRSLTRGQLAQIIIENNVKDDMTLCYLGSQCADAGQPELYNWIMDNPMKRQRLNVIETAWSINNAVDTFERQNKSRIAILEEHLNAEHAVDEDNGITCDGKWLRSAIQILQRNNISCEEWQLRIRNCLQYGRNKMNNVFLLGERNCGKSFLLRPLTLIYQTFCNPASGSFNWVGAQDKEVILLNDFRYPHIDKGADKILPWQDLLNLMDVDKLFIQAPKSFFAENIEWTKRQPILGNGPYKIRYMRAGEENLTETRQMDARVFYFHLKYPIPDEELDHSILACTRCFAHLVLNGTDLQS